MTSICHLIQGPCAVPDCRDDRGGRDDLASPQPHASHGAVANVDVCHGAPEPDLRSLRLCATREDEMKSLFRVINLG